MGTINTAGEYVPGIIDIRDDPSSIGRTAIYIFMKGGEQHGGR